MIRFKTKEEHIVQNTWCFGTNPEGGTPKGWASVMNKYLGKPCSIKTIPSLNFNYEGWSINPCDLIEIQDEIQKQWRFKTKDEFIAEFGIDDWQHKVKSTWIPEMDKYFGLPIDSKYYSDCAKRKDFYIDFIFSEDMYTDKPLPIKQDFQIGKWYEITAYYDSTIYWVKVDSVKQGYLGASLYLCKEIMNLDTRFFRTGGFSEVKKVRELTLEEIQPYLSDDDPEKIKKPMNIDEALEYLKKAGFGVGCTYIPLGYTETRTGSRPVRKVDSEGIDCGVGYLWISNNPNKFATLITPVPITTDTDTRAPYSASREAIEKGALYPEKEWLLMEARKRYPPGTKYRNAIAPSHTSFTAPYKDIQQEPDGLFFPGGLGWIYYKGKWAEIIDTPISKDSPGSSLPTKDEGYSYKFVDVHIPSKLDFAEPIIVKKKSTKPKIQVLSIK